MYYSVNIIFLFVFTLEKDAWSQKRLEYARVLAKINSHFAKKRIEAPMWATDNDDRYRRQKISNGTELDIALDLARGKNKKLNQALLNYGPDPNLYFENTNSNKNKGYGNSKLSYESGQGEEDSSTQCWTCHVATGTGSGDWRDLYTDCLAQERCRLSYILLVLLWKRGSQHVYYYF
jgi:hypothetical protein